MIVTKGKIKRPLCPDGFNYKSTYFFAHRLIKYLGGDLNKIKGKNCRRKNFGEIIQLYPELIDGVEDYFETVKEGNSSWAAYMMCCYKLSFRVWAEDIIKNDKTGNPCEAAYYMNRYCGSSYEWYQSIRLLHGE